MINNNKRPEWLPEDWNFRCPPNVMTCDFCNEKRATNDAMEQQDWVVWCDSLDCATAAQQAIEQEL